MDAIATIEFLFVDNPTHFLPHPSMLNYKKLTLIIDPNLICYSYCFILINHKFMHLCQTSKIKC